MHFQTLSEVLAMNSSQTFGGCSASWVTRLAKEVGVQRVERTCEGQNVGWMARLSDTHVVWSGTSSHGVEVSR